MASPQDPPPSAPTAGLSRAAEVDTPLTDPAERDALVADIVREILAAVPIYRRLPPELVASDVTVAIAANVDLIARTLREGLPEREAFSALADSAGARSDEGVPLGAVAGAYSVGASTIWRRVARETRDPDLLVDLADQLMRYTGAAIATLIESYIPEVVLRSTEQDAAQRALLRSLLDSTATVDPTTVAGPPARGYLVLRAAWEAPDPGAGRDARVAVRRRVGRASAALRTWAPEGVLVDLDADGGVSLLPVDRDPADLDDAQDRGRLDELHTDLQEAVSGPVHLAVVAAVPDGVPAAAATASDVLRAAKAARRPYGVHRLADVLLEVQLTVPGPARAQLLFLLAALEPEPDLLRTLAEYVHAGLDRRAAADALGVHPNTVQYRLRKARVLTGLDPGAPADLLHLTAALLARRAAGAEPAAEA